MIVRAVGAVLLAAACALAIAPAFDWFSAQTPAGAVTATGYQGTGVLWLLPVVAAGVAVGGAAILSAAPKRRGRVLAWAAPLALVSALVAVAITAWAGTGADVVLTVTGYEVRGPVDVPVQREAAARAAAVVAMVTAALALVTSAAAWRR